MIEEYLKNILLLSDWFKSDKQFFTVSGYDAADSLLDGLREDCFPAVLLECAPDGSLSFEDGFLDNRVISLWVLEQVNPADKQAQYNALNRCFERAKTIIKHIVNDSMDNEIAATFDRNSIPYFPRFNIGQFGCGYEFLLTFRTDIDMCL